MGCCPSCCRCCCIFVLVVIIILGISSGFFAGFFPYPSHASCQVNWEFGENCQSVGNKIKRQIEEWSTSSCSSKQQCNYEIISSDDEAIVGKRTTPILQFVDKFNFNFTNSRAGCNVMGFSTSNSWYAVLDFGGNYCNLKNLILGSHLNQDKDFQEVSSNKNCTMYSIAHCNLY